MEDTDTQGSLGVSSLDIQEGESSLVSQTIYLTNSESECEESKEGEKSGLTILDGHFFKIVFREENDSNKVVAACRKCEPTEVLIKGNLNTSSNFLSHLKRRHGEECCDEYNEYKRKKSHFATDQKKKKVSVQIKKKISQEFLNKKIVKFIVHSMVPLRVVEDPYFKKLMSDLSEFDSKLYIMSRRQLGREISTFYNSSVANTIQELKIIPYICTTADIWSSSKRSFFGMTAHYITEGLKRKSIALACRRFKGTHDFRRIAEMIEEIHSEFGIGAEKVVATVTDNASNFIKAFKEFGVARTNIVRDGYDNLYSESSSSEEEYNSDNDEIGDVGLSKFMLPRHLKCCTHKLNLCMTADFKKLLARDHDFSNLHNQVLFKCNKLWKACRRPKSAEIVEKILGNVLSRPGETRWNALYNSLRQILLTKDKCLVLFRELNIKNPFKDYEYAYIEEHIEATKPLAVALDILQGENDIFYGILLPCILTIKIKLQKLKNSNLVYCRPLVESLLSSIEARFEGLLDFTSSESKEAVIASLSLPRFKNSWFSAVDASLHALLTNYFKEAVKEVISREKDLSMFSALRKEITNEESFFEFGSSDNVFDSTNVAGELEVLHYLSDPDFRVECLLKYPAIKKVFTEYNTPLPSSAPVERLFSYATLTNSPRCSRLSDEMFEKRVVLKSTMKDT